MFAVFTLPLYNVQTDITEKPQVPVLTIHYWHPVPSYTLPIEALNTTPSLKSLPYLQTISE
jgi:hypothetical protein